MNELPGPRPSATAACSFDDVADAYDRSSPSYPDEAVSWLLAGARRTGSAPDVLDLGAGTGRLTEQLLAAGCAVTAVDPSEPMLARLVRRSPGAATVAGTAEQVPVRAGSADVVVAAQAFPCFSAEPALREAARVLRQGGRLAVVWNTVDERIPWVRRLCRILGTVEPDADPAAAIDETAMFQAVERRTFRFWQPMTQDSLRDLAASRPTVAAMPAPQRERVHRAVDELYEEYGRGHDGMLLPYVTTVCRTTVLPWALPTAAEPGSGSADRSVVLPTAGDGSGGMDDGLLIDFR